MSRDHNMNQKPVGVECDCPYLNIHDAMAKDHDKAISLLRQCLDEMQYAGWNKQTADQQGRWNVFSSVLNFLHSPIEGEKQ